MSRYFADLSSNNTTFEPVHYREAGHLLVALKATEGQDFKDPHYADRCVEAHRAGLRVVHYHFCRPDNHPRGLDEAREFYMTIRKYLKPTDLVAMDIEVQGARAWWQIVRYSREFYHELAELAGKSPIVYSYTSYLTQAGPGMRMPHGRYWVADYAARLKLPPWLHRAWAWQRTDGESGPEPHQCAGIGRCDVSLLNRATYLRMRARRP